MTIALLAAGSRGDVQPFVALGAALKSRGHAVRVAAPSPFRNLVEAYGLEFTAAGEDVESILESAAVQEAMHASHPLAVIRSFRNLGDLAYSLLPGMYAACRDARAVVFHPGATIGYVAARELGIPSVVATPFPMTPTRSFPALIFYTWPHLGGLFNLASHNVFERIMWEASKGNIRRFWREVMDETPSLRGMPFGEHRTETHPTIVACSRHVFPRPSDWPRNVHMTGPWLLDPPSGWTPPDDLRAFLHAGPTPVYVGFGSMRDPSRARHTTDIVLDALQASGHRAVLALGEGGLTAEGRSDSVFVVRDAPHTWLFPKMSAVVHHGGAGTTAAAVRAGVPSVVVPHANDQPGWAKRLHELGVAPAPIAKGRLDADRLARALDAAHAPDRVHAASELGAAVRTERGADAAAEVIERAVRMYARH